MKLNPWRRSEEVTSPEPVEETSKLGFVERQINRIYPEQGFEDFIVLLKKNNLVDEVDFQQLSADLKSDQFQRLMAMFLKIEVLSASVRNTVMAALGAANPTKAGALTATSVGFLSEAFMRVTTGAAFSKDVVKNRTLFSAIGIAPILGVWGQRFMLYKENPLLFKNLMLYIKSRKRLNKFEAGKISESELVEFLAKKIKTKPNSSADINGNEPKVEPDITAVPA